MTPCCCLQDTGKLRIGTYTGPLQHCAVYSGGKDPLPLPALAPVLYTSLDAALPLFLGVSWNGRCQPFLYLKEGWGETESQLGGLLDLLLC